MSMAPYAIPQGRYGYRMGNATMVDTMIKDALWDAFNDYHMIKTADNICEEWGLTREELDEFALKSQLKAEEAQKNGAFKAEIVPVEGEANGNGTVSPGIALPGETPWRTITVGKTLAPIVETTVPFDVVKPLYSAKGEYTYGRGSWSWTIVLR